MIRQALSLVGGGLLAIGLFWLLALLVAPPDDQVEPPEKTVSMNMVEAPEEAPQEETPPPETNQAATPAPSAPMPTPEPPPVADSTIAMPEVDLPEPPEEPVEMDTELPELTEAQPEPEPEPEPQPEPEPAPEPEPEPTETAEADSEADPSDAEREAAPEAQQAESNEPVNVGEAAPTSRVNPSYPARAQRRGMEGYVEVAFTIRRDGSVDGSSIRITDAQPRRVFDDAAREAIGQWQFEPSERLRNATQRIEFQLR